MALQPLGTSAAPVTPDASPEASAYAYAVQGTEWREDFWQQETRDWLASEEPIDLKRGNEYAAPILSALIGEGGLYEFNGNVPNHGLIDNLPPDCCVEVLVGASKRGLSAIHAGKLPPQCAALVSMSVSSEEMAAEECLTGDARAIFHAICFDPLTSAVLSLAEIRQMTEEIFAANEGHLPTFQTTKF